MLQFFCFRRRREQPLIEIDITVSHEYITRFDALILADVDVNDGAHFGNSPFRRSETVIRTNAGCFSGHMEGRSKIQQDALCSDNHACSSAVDRHRWTEGPWTRRLRESNRLER